MALGPRGGGGGDALGVFVYGMGDGRISTWAINLRNNVIMVQEVGVKGVGLL